jgi:hypothetical protein
MHVIEKPWLRQAEQDWYEELERAAGSSGRAGRRKAGEELSWRPNRSLRMHVAAECRVLYDARTLRAAPE